VGKTGNAITVGCHLHFEIHDHGRPVDPKPFLLSLESSTPRLTRASKAGPRELLRASITTPASCDCG
jgi:hypothetical protein